MVLVYFGKFKACTSHSALTRVYFIGGGEEGEISKNTGGTNLTQVFTKLGQDTKYYGEWGEN